MFITYKVVNLVTGEYYIGSHKTDNPNDNYMGSGKLIKQSIAKYGVKNHRKFIIATFDNRQDSLLLEHLLIKEKRRSDAKILNLSNGGESFDFINNNLSFDRAKFAKLAKHDTQQKQKLERVQEYNTHPNLCVSCKNALPYEKRNNRFCSQSCSAKYNNSHRKVVRELKGVCIVCGKHIHSSKRICSQECRKLYYLKRFSIFHNKRKEIEKHKNDIMKLHSLGQSYRKLGKQYNCSHSYIKRLIQEWTCH